MKNDCLFIGKRTIVSERQGNNGAGSRPYNNKLLIMRMHDLVIQPWVLVLKYLVPLEVQ